MIGSILENLHKMLVELGRDESSVGARNDAAGAEGALDQLKPLFWPQNKSSGCENAGECA